MVAIGQFRLVTTLVTILACRSLPPSHAAPRRPSPASLRIPQLKPNGLRTKSPSQSHNGRLSARRASTKPRRQLRVHGLRRAAEGHVDGGSGHGIAAGLQLLEVARLHPRGGIVFAPARALSATCVQIYVGYE